MTQLYAKNEHDRYDLIGEKFRQLVEDIAAILDWEVKQNSSNNIIHLTNEGRVLQVAIEPYCNSEKQACNPKISIGCMWSLPGHQSLWQYITNAILKQHTTDINCSADRGAKAIAKDIQKRLLPDYFKLWDIALECKQKEDEKESKLKSKTEQLADMIGSYAHPNHKEGNTFSESPKIKPEVGEKLGINLAVHDHINIKAEVNLAYNYEQHIDDVKFSMTLPYELAQELMQWIADRTINCFETWHQEMIDHCIYYLNEEAKSAGQPEVKELPPNNFNWKEAYKEWYTGSIHFSKNSVFYRFKKSITEVKVNPHDRLGRAYHIESQEQPQPEVKPSQETIEQKIERLTRRYDKDALIRAYKEIGYGTDPYQKKDDLEYLTKQFNELSDWIKQVLENGLCKEFPDFYEDVERRDLIAQLITKLESPQPQEQPQPEVKPVTELTETQAKLQSVLPSSFDHLKQITSALPEHICNAIHELVLANSLSGYVAIAANAKLKKLNTMSADEMIAAYQQQPEQLHITREDDIRELFKNSPNQAEILCRLSKYTHIEYRNILKDELLRMRDRRLLRTELKRVREQIKNNPHYLNEERPRRILEILEELDHLHYPTEINLLIKTLKNKFSSFKEAKEHTKTKAVSWQKLAEKLAA